MLNDKDLNKLYAVSIEFGSNWGRPIGELANERLKHISKEEINEMCLVIEKTRREIDKYIENNFDYNKGLTIKEKEAILCIKQNYPWMNKNNISHAISQGIYYAWHG